MRTSSTSGDTTMSVTLRYDPRWWRRPLLLLFLSLTSVVAQPGGSRKPVIDRRKPQQLESQKPRSGKPHNSRPGGGLGLDEDDGSMGPKPLPKSLEFDTSVVQDIKRSLKVLSNDLAVIIDLLDQKLGLRPDDSELIDETTLSRRKAEDLARQKVEKGYVSGNICRSHVAKDIGTSIVHAGAKVLLLSKRPDSGEGDRWEVNIVGTTRRVSYHEIEIQCDPKPVYKADGVMDEGELLWLEEWKKYGSWMYVRQILFVVFFFVDVVIWASMLLFLDPAPAKKRRRKLLQEVTATTLGEGSQPQTAAVTTSKIPSEPVNRRSMQPSVRDDDLHDGGGPHVHTPSLTAAGVTAAGRSAPRGATITAPTGGGSWRSRVKLVWQILLHEDLLAKYVDEYLGKIGLACGIAVLVRMPQLLLDTAGLVYAMVLNLIITLRVLACVTLFIGDSLVMPT